MLKRTATFSPADKELFKLKMLNWANQFNIFCFLDNRGYTFETPAFDFMLAVQPVNELSLVNNSLGDLNASHLRGRWLFGHLSYPDVKHRPDPIGFSGGYFFEPSILITSSGNEVRVETQKGDGEEVFREIEFMSIAAPQTTKAIASIHARYSKAEYLKIIDRLLKHIRRGDCYEINFCQDFYADAVKINPLEMYLSLSADSPNPFSAFYRNNDSYCLCASPERFIKRRGQILISQPIKGTIRRNLNDQILDEQNRKALEQSEKDRCENVMIVDLVRNDMSRVCLPGSVHVSELFGIYSFPQVHQMISSIKGSLADGIEWTGIMKACFPMGSMTGAPKVRVMQLIDEYETVPRGLFSGTIGYIDPAGNFDFNVVIRSLFYNQRSQYVSFKAGGGITHLSKPNEEYEECLLKASAIMKLFRN